MRKSKSRKSFTGLIAFLAVLVVMFIIYNQFLPASMAGKKEIKVEVIQADGSSKTYRIRTKAEFLRGALEDKKLISGSETDLGFYVKTVAGVTADESKNEWWNFTQNGELISTSVDETSIINGGHYEITMTAGW